VDSMDEEMKKLKGAAGDMQTHSRLPCSFPLLTARVLVAAHR